MTAETAELLVPPVLVVPQAQQDHAVPQAPREPGVRRARKGLQAKSDLRVLLVLPVRLEPQVRWERPEHRGHKDYRGRLVHRDF